MVDATQTALGALYIALLTAVIVAAALTREFTGWDRFISGGTVMVLLIGLSLAVFAVVS